MKQETAQKAAKWWADQLRTPAKLDNGDKSDTGAMTFVLATILQASERDGLQNDKIDAFENELAKRIQEDDRGYGSVTLGVDYGPDMILSDSAAVVGLNLGMTGLPWKTMMWIRDDIVKVACGYGASPEEI